MIYETQNIPLKKEIILISSNQYNPWLDHEEWCALVKNNADILMEIRCEDDILLLVRVRK